jgi:ketosteroid isomerase-like protein
VHTKEPSAIVREEYLRAYNLHDANALLALYADDAVLLSESGVFRGKRDIRKWLEFAFDQGSVLESITASRERTIHNTGSPSGDCSMDQLAARERKAGPFGMAERLVVR